jgi:hypothetical protein
VWGLNGASQWEDQQGTSFAAPILAREVALTAQLLQGVCQQGARPYAVTVKAFLALTAKAPQLEGAVVPLMKRALGRGSATRARLKSPSADSAIFVWQGLLEGPDDIARVQMPIPKTWYDDAEKPTLRIVVCLDPPVNAAVSDLWSTRKIAVHLKPDPSSLSLHGSRAGQGSYPLIERTYDLQKLPQGSSVDGDIWLIEISYEQIADYYPGITFTPQQRVAFAAEISDLGQNNRVSPQAAVQALPISLTMTRLSVPPQTVRTPVVIRPVS